MIGLILKACKYVACTLLAVWLPAALVVAADEPESGTVDFNRDIRPILSNHCFTCHGPDEQERKGGTDGLRLDIEEEALADLGGYRAIVRGKPGESELIRRVTSSDPFEVMPPEGGKTLTPRQIELLTKWIEQGAPYAKHWSYVKPVRPSLPDVGKALREWSASQSDAANGGALQSDAAKWESWPRNEIDHFILARLLEEGLTPAPEADRHALVRRVALDLTGLPPTPEEVEQFVNDDSPDAYEKLVDRLLAKEAYGEHWARLWLDLARYADSAGYADDPPRTIWAWRDWVVRALNANMPFDQFTIEQIAGDLLPDPAEDQLVATGFHRNTQTNNEGGTNDEEFRNVAVVDRVNTTLAVWMGTTMACAQCHTHKFDPISQEEYFRFLAIFNNTADADRRDESPFLEIYTDEQRRQKADWQTELAELEQTLQTPTPELLAGRKRWEDKLTADLPWQTLRPAAMKSQAGAVLTRQADDSVLAARGDKTDVYTLEFPLNITDPSDFAGASRAPRTPSDPFPVTALRLETVPHESLPGNGAGHGGGNFVLSRVTASITPPQGERLAGRYVRVELPGKQKMLSLAEVQVFNGADNVAPAGEASQSSSDFDGPARLAIDGNTNGNYFEAKSTTHTKVSDDPWWEVDLQSARPIDRIVLWNRTDGGTHTRLSNFRLSVLDEQREPVWEQSVAEPPNPSAEFSLSGARAVPLVAAFADYAQSGFDAANVIDNKDPAGKGWAVGGQTDKPHALTLVPADAIEVAAGSTLTVVIEQLSRHEHHTLGRFRLTVSDDERAAEFARTPANILALLKTEPEQRSEAQQAELTNYYLRTVAPELQSARERLAAVSKQLSEMKPATTVPIMRELSEGSRRTTRIQYRGNFLDLGPEVTEGLPAVFHPPQFAASPRDAEPKAAPGQRLDRLALAHWLIDEENPLTARVTVNRYWEKLFGIGIVSTSEEFGSQGELPFHPELLDWLAVEFMEGRGSRVESRGPEVRGQRSEVRGQRPEVRGQEAGGGSQESGGATTDHSPPTTDHGPRTTDNKWDVKALLRLMVTSAAYRQSSRVTPELMERDPDNRLLARGPRFRLSAEQIRDQALFVSGLLSPKMYGPPVRPPQPSVGLTAAFGGGIDWQTSEGEDRHRRGLYTTWRRSNPYPSMMTFDAPNREVCTVRRDRTNTPLQALVTLNDPVYVEAAQALARRIAAAGGTVEEQARYGFGVCLSRPPREGEIARLAGLYEEARARFADSPDEARKLATDPLGPAPADADLIDLAAWTVVGNVLLNLDEMFMKR